MTDIFENKTPLSINPTGYGDLSVKGDVDDVAFREFVGELREEAGDAAEISASLMLWAGPWEVFLSIKPALDTAGALLGGVGGVAGLLTLFARKHPEQPIVVNVTNETRVVIDGRELTKPEVEAVNRLFEENSADPSNGTQLL